MEINWKPDKDSNRTLKDQILDYFLQKISSGTWPIGTKILAERKLAEVFEVNRSTITNVLDELRADGILSSKGSRGTVVSNNTWSLLGSLSSPNWRSHIDESIYKPNHKVIQMINKYEFKEGIIRLGTGELSPSLYPGDLVKEILVDISNELEPMSYEPPLGNKKLREVISDHVKGMGIVASPEEILVTSGSLQALHLISIGLLRPGATVLLERPSYLKSLFTFQSAGMLLKGVDMDGNGIDLEKLKASFTSGRSNLVYTIPTYNNPTGQLMDLQKRELFMDLVKENRIPIIEDDAYGDLWIDEQPPKPLKSMDTDGNVLYLGTLSKSFSPGLRIGYLIGPEPVVERLGDIKMQLDYGSSSMSQQIASKWLSEGYSKIYSERLRDELRIRRDYTYDLLVEYFGQYSKFAKPKGGFYIWVKFNKHVNTTKLFEEALKRNVLLNIGNIYDFNENNCLRISYAYADLDQIKEGIIILSDIIGEMI